MASEVIGRSTVPTAGSLLSNVILASASVSNVSNQRHQTSGVCRCIIVPIWKFTVIQGGDGLQRGRDFRRQCDRE